MEKESSNLSKGGALFTEDFYRKLEKNLTRRDVLDIIKRELDIDVPDSDKFSVKEVIRYAILEFENRFKTYRKLIKEGKEDAD